MAAAEGCRPACGTLRAGSSNLLTRPACWSALWGRVEKKRGGVQNRRRLRRAASFVAALAEKSIAPSLLPAHRTGRADFPHPALGRVSRQGMRAANRAESPVGSCLAFT